MLDADYLRIPLRDRSGGTTGWTQVSPQDYEALAARDWHLTARRYATTMIDGKHVYMHRLLLGLTPGDGQQVDHINRDCLDNRRENLRPAIHRQNMQNYPSRGGRSKYRGVWLDRSSGKWVAEVKVFYKKHHLGRYVNELDAARAAQNFRLAHMPFTVEDPIP